MNEIVIRSSEGNPVTTSLLVAEKFGKRHVEVLDSIRALVKVENPTFVGNKVDTTIADKLDGMFYATTQKILMPVGGGVKDTPVVFMNRDGFSLLVMGFTGASALKFKLEFIDAFNAMERRLTSALPSNYLDALKALVSSEEAKQLAESKAQLALAEVTILAPKAKVYDNISNSEGLMSMNDAAKAMKIGRNIMMAHLRSTNVLMKNNTPYQNFIDSGYFKVVMTHVDKAEFNIPVTRVTGKGLTWLAKKFEWMNAKN